jgi:uncharacterized membrane protein
MYIKNNFKPYKDTFLTKSLLLFFVVVNIIIVLFSWFNKIAGKQMQYWHLNRIYYEYLSDWLKDF